MAMTVPAKDSGSKRFSLQERLRDPAVRQGYEEQGAVLEAASLIRQMRESAGLTQGALALKLGTSQPHLSMLERGVGRHGPTFLMLKKIAWACGQELRIFSQSAPETMAPMPRQVTGSTRFRPLHDRIVVRRADPELRSHTGIMIPYTAQTKPAQGEVIAVGPGNRNELGALVPVALAVGDRVLCGKLSGTEVKIDPGRLTRGDHDNRNRPFEHKRRARPCRDCSDRAAVFQPGARQASRRTARRSTYSQHETLETILYGGERCKERDGRTERTRFPDDPLGAAADWAIVCDIFDTSLSCRLGLMEIAGKPSLLKEAKDFYIAVAVLSGSTRRNNKSFLVLFFKKEPLPFYCCAANRAA
jgi:chaperonin GroES